MNNQVQRLPISELFFDPQNPRLPQRLRNKPDSDVLEYLLLECSLIDLMNSIAEKGYFEGEPLLAVPRSNGGYTVVEGNRRLGALKLLTSQEAPPLMPKQVDEARRSVRVMPVDAPVLVFPMREEILGYLGYRHITGIKEWDALAKGRYLQQLKAMKVGLSDAETYQQLAREIGSKADYVGKLLTAVALVDRARDFGILNRLKTSEDDIAFSVLTTALGYQELYHYIGLASSRDEAMASLKQPELSNLFGWLFDKRGGTQTVLGESRNLDKLARVAGNAQARTLLLQGGRSLDEADLYTDGPLQAVRKQMMEAENKLRAAQDALGFVASGLDGSDQERARVLFNLGKQLQASIKATVNDSDDDA